VKTYNSWERRNGRSRRRFEFKPTSRSRRKKKGESKGKGGEEGVVSREEQKQRRRMGRNLIMHSVGDEAAGPGGEDSCSKKTGDRRRGKV